VKIAGLSLEQGRLSAALVQRQFGRMELLDSRTTPVADEAALAAAVRERANAWPDARIVLALPGRLFTSRIMTLPFSDRKRIEKAIPYELEDIIPLPLDGMVLDHLPLNGATRAKASESRVLCAALPKAVLREHLDRFSAVGVDPPGVIPSSAALAAVAMMLPEAPATLVINGCDACLMSGGTVRAVCSIGTGPTGGLRHVVQALETEQKERVEQALVLSGGPELQAQLAELGIAVRVAAPELGGKKALDAVSLGAALITDMNLRKGEFAYGLADLGARSRKRTLFIAGAAAAVLFCVNLGVKYSLVQATYGKADREIREVYRQTFPQEKPASDPVRQMRDRIAEAKKRFGALGSGASALDVMKTVTDGVPREVRVGFQEFLLEGDRLRLQGETPSFDAVDKIKASLQQSPLFAEVTVQDTRMGVDNKVKFRLDIKLKQAM
jgi:general secretion pathway protein L